MKIRCVCVVRDEVDILSYTLDAALRWAHTIYVCDNNSSDGSWELLQEYAMRRPEVVLVDREPGVFRNSLRGEIVNQADHGAGPKDWWCRLDADEIYIDNPCEFLAAIAKHHEVVYSASHQYFFTDADLAAFQQEPTLFTKDWKPKRLRYYLANWSEPRFVRHLPGVQWVDAWPEGFWKMSAAPKRIRVRHYQFRSPPQIERRLHARILNTEDGSFEHEKATQWLPKLGIREEDLVFGDSKPEVGELWRTRVIRASALQREDDEGAEPPQLALPFWHPSPLRSAVNRLLRPLARLKGRYIR